MSFTLTWAVITLLFPQYHCIQVVILHPGSVNKWWDEGPQRLVDNESYFALRLVTSGVHRGLYCVLSRLRSVSLPRWTRWKSEVSSSWQMTPSCKNWLIMHEGRPAIKRDLNRQEKWSGRALTHLRLEQCAALPWAGSLMAALLVWLGSMMGRTSWGLVGSQLSKHQPCLWSATGASSTRSSVSRAQLCNGGGFEHPPALQQLRGRDGEGRNGLLTVVPGRRMTINKHKLKLHRYSLELRNNFFPTGTARQWSRFEPQMDKTLSILVFLAADPGLGRMLGWCPPKVTFSLNDTVKVFYVELSKSFVWKKKNVLEPKNFYKTFHPLWLSLPMYREWINNWNYSYGFIVIKVPLGGFWLYFLPIICF